MLATRTGTVQGTVTDASSSDPIPGVTVVVDGHRKVSDVSGHYRVDGVRLDPRNAPRTVTVYTDLSAGPSDWFSATTTAVVTADGETTLDLPLVPLCGGGPSAAPWSTPPPGCRSRGWGSRPGATATRPRP